MKGTERREIGNKTKFRGFQHTFEAGILKPAVQQSCGLRAFFFIVESIEA
jgi:hypothetical protein